MAERYRRKPTEIEAVQWDGTAKNDRAIWAMGADFAVPFHVYQPAHLLAGKGGSQGMVDVPLGHWVAKAADDDFYPIDPDVFDATYEPIEDTDG